MAEDPSVELIPARSQPAVVIQMDPDLETPLLGPLEVPKSQSRIAPLIVLLGMFSTPFHAFRDIASHHFLGARFTEGLLILEKSRLVTVMPDEGDGPIPCEQQ